MSVTQCVFFLVSDRECFPSTLATCNSVRRFHPGAELVVVNSNVHHPGLNAAQTRLLTDRGVRLVPADRLASLAWGRVPGREQLRAYAAESLSLTHDVVISLAPETLLCAPIDDVLEIARATGRFVGVQGIPELDGAGYAAYGGPVPPGEPKTLSSSLFLWSSTERNRALLQRWAACCDAAAFGPQEEKRYPGSSAASVLNAVLHMSAGPEAVHLLPHAGWPCDGYRPILSRRRGVLVDAADGGTPQRLVRPVGRERFASRAFAEGVLADQSLQLEPYRWFLYLLWFGELRDWGRDPYEYLPESSHHLLRDVAAFYARVAAIDPNVRELWEQFLTVPVLARMRGVASFMPFHGSLDHYIRLAREVPQGDASWKWAAMKVDRR